MTIDIFLLLFKALGLALLWMTFLWLIHILIKNAAIVDVGWALCLFIYALVYAWFEDGFLQAHELILLFIVGLWSFRLSSHLFIDRIYKQKEEGRYTYLREQWKTFIPLKFFLFFHAQTLLNFILAIPFLLLALDKNPNEILIYIGAIICFIGVSGESIADMQLKFFKKTNTIKGKTCRIGLWNYSRHPNYFFEFVYWLGLGFMGQAASNGYLSWIAPAIILTTLFKVTGIPATERQALKSRGEEYKKYMQEVSSFIPMPPKNQ